MRSLVSTLTIVAAAFTVACAGHVERSAPAGAGVPAEAGPGMPLLEAPDLRAVLLVSIDGFHPDYLDPETSPNLLALADEGVRAEALIPSFPTKTFPNHYTMVTGLRPDRHGLVANNIWDPEMEARYGLSDREAVGNPEWYGGVPVWVTAERHEITTAPLFWPGSEAPIDGVRPTHWLHYDGEMPHGDRIEWVLDRVEDGARFATLYFDAVDVAGHGHGPGAAETRDAVARVDSAIGVLRSQLAARGLFHVNLLIVSDHGMSQLSHDRVIFLDDYLDPESTRVIDWNPVLALWPDPAAVDSIYETLRGAHPSLKVFRPEEIPDRYGYGTHDRVAPIIGIADPGWSITTHGYFTRNPEGFGGGNHGYDQRSPEMRALFIANGPAFRGGAVVPPFPNVDVYELIMHVLGLPPEPGDGRLERAEAALSADGAAAVAAP